jgi:hypothetical protein
MLVLILGRMIAQAMAGGPPVDETVAHHDQPQVPGKRPAVGVASVSAK